MTPEVGQYPGNLDQHISRVSPACKWSICDTYKAIEHVSSRIDLLTGGACRKGYAGKERADGQACWEIASWQVTSFPCQSGCCCLQSLKSATDVDRRRSIGPSFCSLMRMKTFCREGFGYLLVYWWTHPSNAFIHTCFIITYASKSCNTCQKASEIWQLKAADIHTFEPKRKLLNSLTGSKDEADLCFFVLQGNSMRSVNTTCQALVHPLWGQCAAASLAGPICLAF